MPYPCKGPSETAPQDEQIESSRKKLSLIGLCRISPKQVGNLTITLLSCQRKAYILASARSNGPRILGGRMARSHPCHV